MGRPLPSCSDAVSAGKEVEEGDFPLEVVGAEEEVGARTKDFVRVGLEKYGFSLKV